MQQGTLEASHHAAALRAAAQMTANPEQHDEQIAAAQMEAITAQHDRQTAVAQMAAITE